MGVSDHIYHIIIIIQTLIIFIKNISYILLIEKQIQKRFNHFDDRAKIQSVVKMTKSLLNKAYTHIQTSVHTCISFVCCFW